MCRWEMRTAWHGIVTGAGSGLLLPVGSSELVQAKDSSHWDHWADAGSAARCGVGAAGSEAAQ